MQNQKISHQLITILVILLLAILACNAPGRHNDPESLTSNIPDPAEHASEEQLQADIQATRDAYFNDYFIEDQIYVSQESANPYNAKECDFDFPQGSDIRINQQFKPGEGSAPDQVTVTIDGKAVTYRNMRVDRPYEFCRSVSAKEDDINPQEYTECLTFNNQGFDLHVEFFDEDGETIICFEEQYTRLAATNIDIHHFDGSWDSGPVCDESSENRYRWQVALIQKGSEVVGTVHFHDCPGGGQVAYAVTGTVIQGDDFILLKGVKSGGAGALYDNKPESQEFRFFPGKPPDPNFGQ